MRIKRKAYSMITWTVTFSLVIAALMIIRSPLKRESEKKVRALTDYSLWGIWGNQPSGERDDMDNIKTKTALESGRTIRQTEEKGVIGYYVDPDSGNYQRVDSASVSVPEGAEAVLNQVDLNQFDTGSSEGGFSSAGDSGEGAVVAGSGDDDYDIWGSVGDFVGF